MAGYPNVIWSSVKNRLKSNGVSSTTTPVTRRNDCLVIIGLPFGKTGKRFGKEDVKDSSVHRRAKPLEEQLPPCWMCSHKHIPKFYKRESVLLTHSIQVYLSFLS